MKRAVADNRVHSTTQIENRCKAEVDATRAQLGRHHPSSNAGSPASEGRMPIMEHTVSRRRRQHTEAVPKALHSSALLIDRDEQWGLSQSVDSIAKGTQLLATPIVARKQNDASNAGVAQYLSLDFIEFDTRDTDHERSERHDVARRPATPTSPFGVAAGESIGTGRTPNERFRSPSSRIEGPDTQIRGCARGRIPRASRTRNLENV